MDWPSDAVLLDNPTNHLDLVVNDMAWKYMSYYLYAQWDGTREYGLITLSHRMHSDLAIP